MQSVVDIQTQSRNDYSTTWTFRSEGQFYENSSQENWKWRKFVAGEIHREENWQLDIDVGNRGSRKCKKRDCAAFFPELRTKNWLRLHTFGSRFWVWESKNGRLSIWVRGRPPKEPKKRLRFLLFRSEEPKIDSSSILLGVGFGFQSSKMVRFPPEWGAVFQNSQKSGSPPIFLELSAQNWLRLSPLALQSSSEFLLPGSQLQAPDPKNGRLPNWEFDQIS